MGASVFFPLYTGVFPGIYTGKNPVAFENNFALLWG
jgi:hypothetical protein